MIKQFNYLGMQNESQLAMAIFAGLGGYMFAATVKNSAYANVFWVIIGLALGVIQIARARMIAKAEMASLPRSVA